MDTIRYMTEPTYILLIYTVYIHIQSFFLFYQENPGNKCDSYNGDTEPAT